MASPALRQASQGSCRSGQVQSCPCHLAGREAGVGCPHYNQFFPRQWHLGTWLQWTVLGAGRLHLRHRTTQATAVAGTPRACATRPAALGRPGPEVCSSGFCL